ncbi:MAG TPA: RdgB/HAM1 family non-canonical purine NTP pyrophosphatase [Candidatus Paceibacterota bacterium]|jgi:XTP/dITP diphosphohydrolase|nr:RdgB/HAM1 family non-canonical purine NTP pyrophosphatase [Candidatus Paceibacterota bacterium]
MAGFTKNRVAWLVTGNLHKFNEVRPVLSKYNIAAGMLRKIDAVEIQDDDIENVAKASALDAVRKSRLPIVVEDAGLFIKTLGSFPGPYSSFVYRTIGNDGVLKVMRNVANRGARFRSVVAFSSPEQAEPLSFSCEVRGEIVKRKRGTYGFGFDPIFKPSSSQKTFAEMTVDEKNKYSHRASAFRRFAEWYAASF